ncbi:MAG: DNA polymerase III subunit beta [Clostridia bacterium]|nr:DNA polymerase III subunit beta [Clostridia bacterium]
MKIKCTKDTLLEATLKVMGAVGSSTISALEGILFSAASGYLTITGYNLEMGITTAVKAQVEQGGQVVLNAKYFSDIIKKAPADIIEIDIDEKLICTIKAGKSKFSIIGIAPEEYPELPAVADGKIVEIEGNILSSLIRKVRFAIAKNNEYPIYTGMLFEVEENQISAVALDGCKVAVSKDVIKNNENVKFVIPEKSVNEISKLAEGVEEKIRISVGDRHVIFEIGHYLFITRLISGEFMNYKDVMKRVNTTFAKVSVNDFYAMADRVALLINDRAKTYVKCIFEDNSVRLSCNSAIGSADDNIEAEIQGERVEIGFNAQFLIDAFRSVPTDEVIIELKDQNSPIKIRPLEGDEFSYLILPTRLI